MMGKVTCMCHKHHLSILPHKSQWEIANQISSHIILEIPVPNDHDDNVDLCLEKLNRMNVVITVRNIMHIFSGEQ